jgi:hypothetical protein
VRAVLACSPAGLAPALVLFPLILRLVGGAGDPRRLSLAVLLAQTVYLLGAAAALGLLRPARGREPVAAAGLLAPVVVALGTALALGADPATLFAAQPAALAWAVLAWGLGRAARDAARGSGVATAITLLALAALSAGLAPVSHLASVWSGQPSIGEALLAANPFILVSSAAGFDLVRSSALYDALALSGYRFHYPGPFLPSLVLALIGAALGGLRIKKPRACAPVHLHSSREGLSV